MWPYSYIDVCSFEISRMGSNHDSGRTAFAFGINKMFRKVQFKMPRNVRNYVTWPHIKGICLHSYTRLTSQNTTLSLNGNISLARKRVRNRDRNQFEAQILRLKMIPVSISNSFSSERYDRSQIAAFFANLALMQSSRCATWCIPLQQQEPLFSAEIS